MPVSGCFLLESGDPRPWSYSASVHAALHSVLIYRPVLTHHYFLLPHGQFPTSEHKFLSSSIHFWMSRINIFQRIRDKCEISRIYQIIICANRRKCPLPVRECEAVSAARWSHGASCSCSSVCKTLARLLAGAGAGAGCGLTPQLRKVASRTLSPLPARARPPAASSYSVSQQKPATVSLPASSHRTTLDKCTNWE